MGAVFLEGQSGSATAGSGRRSTPVSAPRGGSSGTAGRGVRGNLPALTAGPRMRSVAKVAPVRKLQSQGVHHITIVGADRQTSIDFWEGVLGMPFVFEQPNLDNASESHLYFDPGDGRLITVFTNEERTPDPTRTPTDPGCVHHLAFALSQATFRQAVERLDERGIQHSGVKDRGFMDSIYFKDPLGLLIELASYRFEPPSGYTHADVLLEAHKLRVERGDHNIAEIHLADAIEVLVARSRAVAVGRPIAEGSRTEPPTRGGDAWLTITLHVLKPSVNNLTVADLRSRRRARLRGGRRLGKDRRARVPGEEPGPPDADDRGGRAAPRDRCGRAARSCSTSATSTGSTSSTRPTRPQRAMVDSAMFYLIGTLYPLVARATYPALGFPQYPGEVGSSDADDETKAEAQQAAEAALAEPLDAYRAFFLDGKPFIGGDQPSIADIRLAATLEFLNAIDYDAPRLGDGVHRARWRRRSATPTPSPRPTSAATSPR